MNSDVSKETNDLIITVNSIKVRSIDPPIVVDGKLVPLSELAPDYATRRAAHIAERGGPLRLRLRLAPSADA